MSLHSHHAMHHVATHSSGAEEWLCHECGRRLLFEWAPDFRMTTLVTGNALIIHTGAHPRPAVQSSEASKSAAGTPTAATGPVLARWTTATTHDGPGEPERIDGMAPWLRALDEIARRRNYLRYSGDHHD